MSRELIVCEVCVDNHKSSLGDTKRDLAQSDRSPCKLCKSDYLLLYSSLRGG